MKWNTSNIRQYFHILIIFIHLILLGFYGYHSINDPSSMKVQVKYNKDKNSTTDVDNDDNNTEINVAIKSPKYMFYLQGGIVTIELYYLIIFIINYFIRRTAVEDCVTGGLLDNINLKQIPFLIRGIVKFISKIDESGHTDVIYVIIIMLEILYLGMKMYIIKLDSNQQSILKFDHETKQKHQILVSDTKINRKNILLYYNSHTIWILNTIAMILYIISFTIDHSMYLKLLIHKSTQFGKTVKKVGATVNQFVNSEGDKLYKYYYISFILILLSIFFTFSQRITDRIDKKYILNINQDVHLKDDLNNKIYLIEGLNDDDNSSYDSWVLAEIICMGIYIVIMGSYDIMLFNKLKNNIFNNDTFKKSCQKQLIDNIYKN